MTRPSPVTNRWSSLSSLIVALCFGCVMMATGCASWPRASGEVKEEDEQPSWIDRLRPDASMVERKLGYRGGLESQHWERTTDSQ